ncbi:glycosyltransferase [Anaerovorax odorimutans]|uniref:glycosyltransferase n=1 Tax=Anaerovorax odorimutans TaxID=109327 RepID=UPI00041229F7|nr:glycosyltransferase [Anaerovorax odorimutans]
MKDLSIVILYRKNYILPCMEILKPIMEAYDTELIIISNESIHEQIPYKYDKIKFSQEYRNFKEFCISSCLGKRIMLIECGMTFTPTLINFIMENLKNDDYFNISCTIRSFLSSDKRDVFIHNEVILYNRGITGFNQYYTDDVVLDVSFIQPGTQTIDLYISRLIEKKAFNELYLWFSLYIKDLSREDQAYCYTRLEKIKSEMPETDWHTLEKLFINSETENIYNEFLTCRNGYLSQSMSIWDIINKIEKISISLDDNYFSWLLKDFIIQEKGSLDLIKNLPETVLKNCLLYLLENDPDSWEYLNTFLSNLMNTQSTQSSAKNITEFTKKETAAFTKFTAVCLEYMNNHVYSQRNKDIMMNIFTKYTALGENQTFMRKFPKGSRIINTRMEKKLIVAMNKVHHMDADHAIEQTSHLCKKNINKNNILRYYIQKLRYTNTIYSKILSICMIVKDEEKNLSRCLSSIRPLMDCGLAELIIVDTGSVDSTVKIARSYTDKVYLHEWEDNFSKARNQSVMYSDAEYIFIMDADEELRPADTEALKVIFSGDDYHQLNTFTLNIISYTDTELQNYAVMAQPRIFKNDYSFRYSSSVHNQPLFRNPLKNLEIGVLHYGYIMTPDIREKKYQRTTTLLKKGIQNNPRSIYFHFQLCNSYAMYGDLKNALRQVEIYMRLISEETELHDNVLMYYNNAAAVYINCYSYDKSERICDKALDIEPDFIDFIYYKAFIRFEQEDYENALPYFKQYLSLIDHYGQMKTSNDGRFAFYTICSHEDIKRMLLQSHYRLHQYEECINDMYTINSETVRINCIYEFMSSCLNTGNTLTLANFYAKYAASSANQLFEKTFRYFENVLQNEAPKNTFYELDKYSWDALDFESFWPFLYEILLEILKLEAENIEEEQALIRYKKILQLILHRTKKLLYGYLSAEELVDIYSKYMFICSRLTALGNVDQLEIRERAFIKKILEAYKVTDSAKAIELLQDAILEYHEMKGIVDLSIDILFKPSSAKDTKVPQDVTVESDANNVEKEIHDLVDKINEEILQLETVSTETSEALCQNISDINNLITELENYNNLLPVQIYLCRFYSLTKQYKKSMEAYCRLKLHNPSENSVQKEKLLIPPSLLQSNPDHLRILHGTMDNTEKTIRTVNLLKEKGLDAKALNYIPRQCKYTCDYEMDVNQFENGAVILDRTIDATAVLIPSYDIFHFHNATSLHFNHDDLAILQEFNKKLVVDYWGQSVRTSTKAAQLSPYIQLSPENDLEILKKLELFSKYASCCIVENHEVYEYAKDFFENIQIISPFVRPSVIARTYVPYKINSKFTIIHSPENRRIAGTEYLLKAVEELKEQYSFDFQLTENIPIDQAQKIYQSADLIIDELLVGSYSRYAIEAMAMGKPVMGYISDFMRDKYPKELPLILTTPESVKSDLENILQNKDMLIDIGKAGSSFVQQYHNADTQIDKLIKLYHDLV